MRNRSSFSLVSRSLWSWVRGGLLGGVTLGLVSSCSLIVETKVEQCSTDTDCTGKGSAFAGTHCSSNHLCVSEGSGDGCSVNADCPEGEGEKKICRQSDHQCASLLSAECQLVEGNYRDDSAVILGSILPIPAEGGDRSTGLACLNGIRLASQQISDVGNIQVTGGQTRSLAFVHCNDNSDSDTSVRAADHLVNNVKVPAIIGPVFSGITTAVAKDTIKARTLIISPSATSALITGLDDAGSNGVGLVWRTAPSDNLQANALSKLMNYLEPRVRKDDELDKGGTVIPTKVAIINKGDSYGSGLATSLEKILVFNGAKATSSTNEANYVAFDYGDPTHPETKPTNYPGAVTQILTATPHIIFLFGSAESVSDVFTKVEQQWPTTGAPRPFYVFADAGDLPDTAIAINALAPTLTTGVDLHARVLGTIPGANSDRFGSYRSLYNKNIHDGSSPDTFGSAGSYDATFLLSLSIAAQAGGAITGETLALGLTRLVPPGDQVGAGDGTQLQNGFKKLSGDTTTHVDFDGASGPLDFDVTTGEAISDIQYWCVPTGAATPRTPGAFYSASMDTTQSTDLIDSACK